MSDVIDLAFSLPTIIFTISTVFFLGFWILTTVFGAGVDALDDLDIDLDADVDTDVEGGSSGGLLYSALEFLGIAGMPVLLALNLISIFAWGMSMTVMSIAGEVSGAAAIATGLLVFFGSFLFGGLVTGRIAQRFSYVLQPTFAIKRRELVGKSCVLTTQRVTADFGQAEVRDDEGGSLIVQVRCPRSNTLGSGDRALIISLDADNGVFEISPDPNLVP